MNSDTVLDIIKSIGRADSLSPNTLDWLAQMRAKIRPQPFRCNRGMVFGPQTKYVSWHFENAPFNSLELLQITDVQFGNKSCRYDRVIEYRDWVLEKPNRFVLDTGDAIDAWAFWSPGRPWDQLFGPDSQVYRFCDVWAPVQHRFLGRVGGNHERRAIPGFGDLGQLIAFLMGWPYSSGRQIVDIYFGEHHPFKITLWHGRGGARTKGTVAQVLDRFMRTGDSQLYLMGHLHQPMVIPRWHEVREGKTNRLKLKKVFGAVGSSFLELYGSYGEEAGFDPSDVMMARAVLEKSGRWELTLK